MSAWQLQYTLAVSATPVENILRGASTKDSVQQEPQQQQAEGSDITPDEKPGEAGPFPPPW